MKTLLVLLSVAGTALALTAATFSPTWNTAGRAVKVCALTRVCPKGPGHSPR